MRILLRILVLASIPIPTVILVLMRRRMRMESIEGAREVEQRRVAVEHRAERACR